MSVEIDILYEGELHCRATHLPSGKTLATDAPVDNGGKGETFSPTDLVATALGCCIMTIMALVAQRSGVDLTGARVHVVKEMISEPVRRIGTLKVTIAVPDSKNLSQSERVRLERAADLCPVKQSLHPDIRLLLEFHYGD
jgi:putative redox protein